MHPKFDCKGLSGFLFTIGSLVTGDTMFGTEEGLK